MDEYGMMSNIIPVSGVFVFSSVGCIFARPLGRGQAWNLKNRPLAPRIFGAHRHALLTGVKQSQLAVGQSFGSTFMDDHHPK